MTAEEVYQYFGSAYSAAKAIGITKQSFSEWIEKRFIPFNRQIEIQKITKGKLIAREEDAKKPSKDAVNTELNYLPNYRYYDKKRGMCRVDSINFRKGKPPKITYMVKGNNREKFSVFSAKNLMQAADLLDSKGKMLYEGDICLLKNGEKFIFKSLDMVNKLKKAGKFKIIGSVFE